MTERRHPRFSRPPEGFAWLYLIGRANGVVKVGITCNPEGRMVKHRDIVWRHYCATGPRTLIAQVEATCRRTFAVAAKPIRNSPTCEDFTGINREQAIALARAAVASTRELASHIEAHRVARKAERAAWLEFRQLAVGTA